MIVFVTSGWCMVCWCVNKVWCFCVFVFVRLKVCGLLVNYCVMLYVIYCELRCGLLFVVCFVVIVCVNVCAVCVCVCCVRELLCDVVWFVGLCFLRSFVCLFVLNVCVACDV